MWKIGLCRKAVVVDRKQGSCRKAQEERKNRRKAYGFLYVKEIDTETEIRDQVFI